MTEQADAATKTILLVEDQEIIAMLIAHMVKNAGYQHEHAENGQVALGMLRSGLRPDLILLDVVMPEMDGYQFLEELQRDDSLKDTPVVMLTALSDANDVLKAVKRGAMDYCTKPVDPDDLLATISRVMATHKGDLQS